MNGYFLSPSYGRVLRANSKRITIFIPFKENHKIYTPYGGKIKSIKFEKGRFKRKIFESEKIKRGRSTIFIESSKFTYFFYIEVGFPYRPNRIIIKVNKGDIIRKGQLIGEILLGSLTEIFFPEDKKISIKSLVSIGDKVIGGKTKIAKWSN